MRTLKVTNRTKVHRLPKRAAYDTDTIYNILDATFICQVGFKVDGQVNIIPTAFGRKDDRIFIHGAKNSRMLKALNSGEDVCISVTLVNGIVLARSAFHHSINYRSVVLFSKPEMITKESEKVKALEVIMEHIIPGRWNEVRKPVKKELNVTSVFSFKIEEASAKVRTGPPNDDEDDLELNVWAGVLPLDINIKEPIRVETLNKNIPLPDYIKNFNILKQN